MTPPPTRRAADCCSTSPSAVRKLDATELARPIAITDVWPSMAKEQTPLKSITDTQKTSMKKAVEFQPLPFLWFSFHLSGVV